MVWCTRTEDEVKNKEMESMVQGEGGEQVKQKEQMKMEKNIIVWKYHDQHRCLWKPNNAPRPFSITALTVEKTEKTRLPCSPAVWKRAQSGELFGEGFYK